MPKNPILLLLTFLVFIGCTESANILKSTLFSSSNGSDEEDGSTDSEQLWDDVSKTNSIGMEFVLVGPGTFRMGSNDGESDEQPVHDVRITQEFYIGKFEVTQSQWQTIMDSNPSQFKGSYLPIENVSWFEIQTFIQRLNEREGGIFYRLPTESEWEYAAKGGLESRGFIFSGSDNIDDVSWYAENSESRTQMVGTKTPNELGIYDMSGNVWEWCDDWYDESYYSQSPVQDPRGPNSGTRKVIRGGSWSSFSLDSRVENRDFYAPSSSNSFGGFRLVRRVN